MGQVVKAIDFQDVFVLQIVGYINRESFVATVVRITYPLAVEGDPCAGIHGPEVQDHSAFVEALGEGEGLAIVQGDAIRGRDAQPRQKRFATRERFKVGEYYNRIYVLSKNFWLLREERFNVQYGLGVRWGEESRETS